MTLDALTALGYELDTTGTIVAVRGFGIATIVDVGDAAAIDSLADPAAHAERRFQYLEPDAHQARRVLEQKGYTVVRVDPAVDVFQIIPPASARAAAPVARATPAELVTLAATAATIGGKTT